MSDVAIGAIGMITSIGDAITSCAAARAGLSNASELKVMSFGHDVIFGEEEGDEIASVSGHATSGVADGFVGVAKVLALGAKALADALAARPLSPREHARTGLFVNLKDGAIEDADFAESVAASEPDAPIRERQAPSLDFQRKAATVGERLSAAVGLEAQPSATVIHFGGNAGVAALVEDASARIARGALDRCLVGGVESRVEPRFLSAAARLGLLRTNRNPVGFAPGEAACFFLLERADDLVRAGVRGKAVLLSAVKATDERSYLRGDPPDGRGLASVLGRAVRSSSAGLLISDHGGSERRAFDMGNAVVRLRSEQAVDALTTWYPAVNFGDTGAAAGALGLCVAIRAFERGYAPAGGAVVSMASEGGDRGAIGLGRWNR